MYAHATPFTTFSLFASTADFMSGVHYYDDVEMEDVFAVAMDGVEFYDDVEMEDVFAVPMDVDDVEMEDAEDDMMEVSML